MIPCYGEPVRRGWIAGDEAASRVTVGCTFRGTSHREHASRLCWLPRGTLDPATSMRPFSATKSLLPAIAAYTTAHYLAMDVAQPSPH